MRRKLSFPILGLKDVGVVIEKTLSKLKVGIGSKIRMMMTCQIVVLYFPIGLHNQNFYFWNFLLPLLPLS